MNELIIYIGAYTTAPATPGLLIIWRAWPRLFRLHIPCPESPLLSQPPLIE